MRWLLFKDLRILRRSAVLVGTLVLYPVLVALLIGFAISSPPGKPKVAVYTGSNVAQYAGRLFSSIDRIDAPSPAAAVADVRSGRALAAVIVPKGIGHEIESLVQDGTGHPTVTVVLNNRNPLERSLAEQAIQSRVDDVQRVIAKQVLGVAVADLQRVLRGGKISLLGRSTHLLGLVASRAIVADALTKLPPDSKLAPELRRVVAFADVAIAGLTFATPVLGDIGSPLTIHQVELAGRTTPSSTYAIGIAAVFLLMFVATLVAAGMLALERSENAYARLVRGLVAPSGLLGEKVVLAAACAFVETVAMAAVVSIVVPIAWGSVAVWLLGMLLGGLAFGAVGIATGALAREVSVASLLAFLVSLPVALAALIPSTAVSGTVAAILNVISFLFPFRACLQIVAAGFGGTGASIGPAALHLIVITLAFALVARAALPRFGSAR